MKQSVSLLCHTLSGNAFGRAWVLAQLLRDDFDVHIVAACRSSDQLWAPARTTCDVEVRRWTPWSYPGFLARAANVACSLITGDVVYAVKPHLTSLGLGLRARGVLQRPLIADVDDWELGFSSLGKDVLRAPWALFSAASSLHTRRMSARVRSADAVTISSSFLHEKYGGTWIPHARHVQAPAAQLERSEIPTIIFVGTPRRHKGLSNLLDAFARVRKPAQLRIIGGTLDGALVHEAQRRGDDRVRIEPPVAMEKLFAILSGADVVVIPQRASSVSCGQLPAKLLDAMAVGRPIVSTSVGDIPRWLGNGAGVVVPPDDVGALADAIDQLLANPQRARALGETARARLAELGSFEVVRPRLVALVRAVARGQAPPTTPAPFA